MNSDTVTIRAKVIERHDRAVVALHGTPARPVVIPLANVDAEPDGESNYRFTMSKALAKEVGVYV